MLTGAGRALSLTQRTARKLGDGIDVFEFDVTVPEHVESVRDACRRQVGSRRRRAALDRVRPAVVPRRRLLRRAVGGRRRRHAHLDLLAEDARRRVRAVDGPRRRVRRARLRQPPGVARLQLDGRRQVGAAERQPLPGPRARAEADPLQPRRRRSGAHDGRQVDPGLRPVRGHVGRPCPARLGRQQLRAGRPGVRRARCPTGSPPPPARSSTSTAATTPSA